MNQELRSISKTNGLSLMKSIIKKNKAVSIQTSINSTTLFVCPNWLSVMKIQQKPHKNQNS